MSQGKTDTPRPFSDVKEFERRHALLDWNNYKPPTTLAPEKPASQGE